MMGLITSWYHYPGLYLTGRSKSPKSPRGSSQERPTSASENFTVRDGSLKAWKMEQDKIRAEEDERERVRSAKRSKSPKKVRMKISYHLLQIY